MTRRRIEAWAAVKNDRVMALYNGANPEHFANVDERLAKLVEHEPRAEAVVRAAVKWAHLNRNSEGPASEALNRAVSALQASRKKRR